MDLRLGTAWLISPLFIQIKAFFIVLPFHIKRFKAGKVKMPVTTVDPSSRVSSVHYETYEEMKARHAAKARAVAEFKSLRKELGLSQGSLAQALRVPRRTLEGWESGRFPINPTAEVLARVMRAYPKVRADLAR